MWTTPVDSPDNLKLNREGRMLTQSAPGLPTGFPTSSTGTPTFPQGPQAAPRSLYLTSLQKKSSLPPAPFPAPFADRTRPARNSAQANSEPAPPRNLSSSAADQRRHSVQQPTWSLRNRSHSTRNTIGQFLLEGDRLSPARQRGQTLNTRRGHPPGALRRWPAARI